MALELEKEKANAFELKKVSNIFTNKKFIVLSIIAVIVIFFTIRYINNRSKPTAVNVEGIVTKDIVQTISVSGSIEANDVDKSVLSISQKVSEVLAEEGTDVKAGDPLVKLDTSDLDYQLEKAKISLVTAEANDKNGRKTTEDAVTQAEVNFAKAQGDYDAAKRKFDANQSLFDSGYISKDEYEASKKSSGDLENQLKIVQMQLDNANRNLSDYNKSSSQKQQLNGIKADIDNLNKKISDSTITSGIDGRVVKMDAVQGEYPRSDKNTVMVCDISSYKFAVGVSQFDAVKLKIDQEVTVKVKGVANSYKGVISKIGQVADILVSGTNKESKVSIQIKIANPDDMIKVGYDADGDIVLNKKAGIVTVAFDSIKQDDKGKYVFVIEGGLAKKRYVKTGIEADFDVEIIDGLTVGENYIVSPSDSLKEGSKVAAPKGE